MNRMIKNNIVSLVSLSILLLMGLGTARDTPHSYMSAIYGDDSALYEAVKEEDFTIPGLGMKMVWVGPGKFTMGSPETEGDRYDNERAHEVKLTHGFWLGKHEVTVGDFKTFVEATGHRPHSEMANALYNSVTKEKIDGKNWRTIFGNDPRRPVVGVSKFDAYAFCQWLTERERGAGQLPEGYLFTLPTEAQWECACRAGSSAGFSFGDDYDVLYRYANYADRNATIRDRDQSHDDGYRYAAPVGSFQPNAWGLHDMHGNVSELCADTYWMEYQDRKVIDPLGPATVRRDRDLVRGGGWCSLPRNTRSAARQAVPAMDSYCDIGFRVVLRPGYAGVLHSLTGANRDWSLIRMGDTSRISHRQLRSEKIAKVIHFPDRRSLGFPRARIRGQETVWVDLPMRASGKLEVPEDVEIKLHVNRVNIKSDADLAPLESLRPDDLRAIELSEPRLSSAALHHIAELTGLREVQINSRRVRDSGLKYLFGLADLEKLDLEGTKVRGPGLDYLKGSRGLRFLGLSGTKLDNEGLERVAGFRQLEILKIDHTKVGGDEHGYLKPLSSLKELRKLDLSRTAVTDSGLGYLSDLRNLEYLSLADTSITGEGLRHLSNLRNLKELDLRKTEVGDAGLACLSGLTNLERLSAGEMWATDGDFYDDAGEGERGRGIKLLTDGGLGHLSGMRNLRSLSLNRTEITGRGFSYLTELNNLRSLWLNECRLTDDGLAYIAGLEGLEEVAISGNRITNSGLTHLLSLPGLKRVVAIATMITKRGADDFMAERKGVEVILEESLDEEFQSYR